MYVHTDPTDEWKRTFGVYSGLLSVENHMELKNQTRMWGSMSPLAIRNKIMAF
jgi:hypothetical protein